MGTDRGLNGFKPTEILWGLDLYNTSSFLFCHHLSTSAIITSSNLINRYNSVQAYNPHTQHQCHY